jgi:hypothetical protein
MGKFYGTILWPNPKYFWLSIFSNLLYKDPVIRCEECWWEIFSYLIEAFPEEGDSAMSTEGGSIGDRFGDE